MDSGDDYTWINKASSVKTIIMGKNRSRHIIVSVIDSDLIMRQILSSMLRHEKGISLVGSSGFKGIDKGLSKLQAIQPDLVFLGVNRSDSEEMKFFYRIREELPDVFVILLTPLNRNGALAALQGLKHGAIDYVTKPEQRNGLIMATRHFQKRVLPVINSIPRLNSKRLKNPVSTGADITAGNTLPARSRNYPNSGIQLIVIGSCMGGVTSLYEVISKLPENLTVPVVIVQHMPKIYTRELSEELDKLTPLNVREALNNSLLLPGQIYVAPGGFHSVIKNEGNRKKIYLHKGPREHECRPSIDVMLRSASQAYNGNVLSLFLSGGGTDGVTGASHVLELGGSILLESKESSLIWDMASCIRDKNPGVSTVAAESLVHEIMKKLFTVRGQADAAGLIQKTSDKEEFLAGSYEV